MTVPSEPRLEVMSSALRAWFCERAPFREDRALADELCREAQPVLRALCVTEGPDPSGALYEGFALVNLLGRRAGLLGATPSAALAACRGLTEALAAGGAQLPSTARDQLEAVCLEGYCGGRDDRLREEVLGELMVQQLELPLAPRCHALVLSGGPSHEALEAWLDGAMRSLFRAEVQCVVVDTARLQLPDDGGARIVASALITAASLGTHIALVASHGALLPQREQLSHHPGFAAALAHALRLAGHTRRRSWPEALGLGRRRGDR
jgi:hypothetical protein